MELNKRWRDILETLDFAFQPIISISSGTTYAVEALLRGWNILKFSSVFELFDMAYEEGVLFRFDMSLRQKALEKFISIPFWREIKLFYNLDNRIPHVSDYSPGETDKILKNLKIPAENLCFEISERERWVKKHGANCILSTYKDQGYRIALDDYGSGYSGLQLLYNTEPTYVKIDRFFISNIDKDSKKKLFVSNIVKLAHTLGIKIVAEGVETANEFLTCKELECDILQGYFIERPNCDIASIKREYSEKIPQDNRKAKNNFCSIKSIMKSSIDVAPLPLDKASFSTLFELFQKNRYLEIIPIVNRCMEPIGIIHEHSLKEYVYAPYGKLLLEKKSHNNSIKPFIISIPSVDISSSLESMLDRYHNFNSRYQYLFITEDGKYRGILNPHSLLRAIHEQEIQNARDINPLTGLPGNNRIKTMIQNLLLKKSSFDKVFIYFDLDNFKPFNDHFGFRTGDRVIQLIADIIKREASKVDLFIGHIGGDDFFCCGETENLPKVIDLIISIRQIFKESARSFYSADQKSANSITMIDRQGRLKKFPLLSVSIAVAVVSPLVRDLTETSFHSKLAKIKDEAKLSPEGVAIHTFTRLSPKLFSKIAS